jgi:hypothetical protein
MWENDGMEDSIPIIKNEDILNDFILSASKYDSQKKKKIDIKNIKNKKSLKDIMIEMVPSVLSLPPELASAFQISSSAKSFSDSNLCIHQPLEKQIQTTISIRNPYKLPLVSSTNHLHPSIPKIREAPLHPLIETVKENEVTTSSETWKSEKYFKMFSPEFFSHSKSNSCEEEDCDKQFEYSSGTPFYIDSNSMDRNSVDKTLIKKDRDSSYYSFINPPMSGKTGDRSFVSEVGNSYNNNNNNNNTIIRNNNNNNNKDNNDDDLDFKRDIEMVDITEADNEIIVDCDDSSSIGDLNDFEKNFYSYDRIKEDNLNDDFYENDKGNIRYYEVRDGYNDDDDDDENNDNVYGLTSGTIWGDNILFPNINELLNNKNRVSDKK